MSNIDSDHLKRTLAHPLLQQIFVDYCDKQGKKRVIDFWLEIEEYRGIYDEIWLRIRANKMAQVYIFSSVVPILEELLTDIRNKIKNNEISPKMFDQIQQYIFDQQLKDLLRSFLQSDTYHEKYDQLRKAALWICLRNIRGALQEARGNIYCTITYEEEIATSSLTSPQNINWKEVDKIHKLEIVANPKNFVIIQLFLQNQSIWQTDQHIGTAQILLKDIWDERPREMWLPLQSTISGYSDLLLLVGVVLVHRPANGLMVNELDFTNPLAACCSYGHFGAVKQLLADNSSIDSRVEDSDRTPLHIAVVKNRGKIAQYLLHKQADPNLVDAQCHTPLHLAAIFSPNLCHLLVAAGARIDVKELFENGQTPLHSLATHNYTEALQYLLEKNANVNSQTLTGTTPLHKAILHDSLDSVKILVNFSADMNIEDDNGLSPIKLAESRKNNSSTSKEIYNFLNAKMVIISIVFNQKKIILLIL